MSLVHRQWNENTAKTIMYTKQTFFHRKIDQLTILKLNYSYIIVSCWANCRNAAVKTRDLFSHWASISVLFHYIVNVAMRGRSCGDKVNSSDGDGANRVTLIEIMLYNVGWQQILIEVQQYGFVIDIFKLFSGALELELNYFTNFNPDPIYLFNLPIFSFFWTD